MDAKAPATFSNLTYAQLSKAVDEILPLVESEAGESERISHQTDKLVTELRRRGLYALLTPKAVGGPELTWVEAMRLAERVAHADGSAGWCLMVEGVMNGSVGAFIPDEGARTIYGKGPDVTIAGNGVPRGFARAVDGGWMVKGHWSYGSAIWHAEFIHSGCFVMDGDTMKIGPDGAPEIVLIHHPKDTIELKGNWDVLGLRGTGSFDYTLKGGELFIPSHMSYPFNASKPARGGAQYGTGLVAATAWGHTSWALGVGRRVLDELAGHARSRTDLFGKLADSLTFRKSFAEAEAKYRAARAMTYSAWGDLSDTFAAGRKPTLEQVTMLKLVFRHLHDVISETSTFAHKASRGASLRPGKLQRAYRDIHAGTQHVLLADEIMSECGKALLGVAGDKAEWGLFAIHAPGDKAKAH